MGTDSPPPPAEGTHEELPTFKMPNGLVWRARLALVSLADAPPMKLPHLLELLRSLDPSQQADAYEALVADTSGFTVRLASQLTAERSKSDAKDFAIRNLAEALESAEKKRQATEENVRAAEGVVDGLLEYQGIAAVYASGLRQMKCQVCARVNNVHEGDCPLVLNGFVTTAGQRIDRDDDGREK